MSFVQAARPLQIQTVLGPDVLLVTGLTGEEEISRPFHVTVRLASEQRAIDGTALIGTPTCVSVTTPSGGTRLVHGLVRRFRNMGRAAGTGALALTAYEAELVPWFWMLTLSRDCRIFQHLSVPDIVAQVFRGLGFTDFIPRLVRTYPPREYCVQYRETHFAFVSRLLEEEGIAYHFEHAEDKHTLVLTDGPAVIKPCPDLPSIRPERLQAGRTGEIRAGGGRAGATLPGFVPPGLPQAGVSSPGFAAPRSDGVGANPDGDTYTSLILEQAIHTRAVSLTDYDYEHPTTQLAASLAADNGFGEAFDYPGKFTEAAEGDRYARLRLEAAEAEGETASGVGAAPGLTSGCKITVEGDGPGTKKRAWLIVRVTHTAQQALGSGLGAGNGDAPFSCETRFTLASLDVPWRPPRLTPRPRVDGTQSALVVGKAGEEIWTDAQGRVKLHFYWDRLSKKDETASCWVRCATAWAGRGYGQFSVPRIGQEVLVDFLEGDPDRPVVVGRVYNADQPPPGHTGGGGALGVLSGLQSKTHKGSGANSMTMDDTAGKEKIAIHAQYDMTTDVGHDQTLSVKNKRSADVTSDDSETVGGKQTVAIAGERKTTVGGPHHLTVAGIQEVSAGGKQTINAQAGQEVHVTGTQQTTVSAARTTEIGAGDTLTVTSGLKISAGASVEITGTTELKLTGPSGSITIGPGGISIEASAPITLKAPIIKNNS